MDYKKYKEKAFYVEIAIFELASSVIFAVKNKDRIKISQAIIRYSIIYNINRIKFNLFIII